jgi:16S rRNA (cytidine1402-2'-O)-methyltransferase
MAEVVEPGVLYVVSTPIGNLGDITLRAITILQGVDLVAAEDTRTTGSLLKHLGIEKPMVSFHGYNEVRRLPQLIAALEEGRSVAVVTDAGTPGVSDPAYAMIREAVAAGKRVIPIPGASAVLAALVMSGLPMDRFVFEGFLPLKKGRRTRLLELSTEWRTIVLYEAPHRIGRTLGEIAAIFGERRMALAREITKKFEETRRGTAAELLEELATRPVKGECVLVIEGVRGAGRDRKSTESLPDEDHHGEEEDAV